MTEGRSKVTVKQEDMKENKQEKTIGGKRERENDKNNRRGAS